MGNTELLRSLSEIVAPSGCEAEMEARIRELVNGYCDAMERDNIGNLAVRILPKGNKPKGKIMLISHMDEVGFMVKNIDGDGRLRLTLLGSLDTRTLSGRRVKTASGICGVVAAKPIHAQSGDERQRPTPADKLYVELGTKSREETEALPVTLGEYGTFAPKFTALANGNVAGKALGGRSMCMLLCELIREIYPDYDGENELCFVFSVKREIARAQFAVETAAFTYRPDTAILLDAAPTADFGDTPENLRGATLGHGVVIAPCDIGTVYDRALFAEAMGLAEKMGIAHQTPTSASLPGGEGKTVNKAVSGIRTLSLSIPTRNLHSGAEIIKWRDYEATAALVRALLMA